MKTKKCSKCGEIKPLCEFYKNNSKPDGYQAYCKTCIRKSKQQYYLNNLNPKQLKNRKKKKKRKKLLKEDKYICSKCGKTKPLSEFHKSVSMPHGYSYNCKDCKRKLQKKWYSRKSQDIKWIKYTNEQQRKHYHNDIEHRRKHQRKYYHNNIEHYRKQQRKYWANKKDNPQVKLNTSISSSISHSLKGNKNGRHWENLVGYTLDELKTHLEKQFDNKMTWNNYGKYWHVDHIIPKSKFNFTKPEHIGFKKAWSLENLQPLEAIENMRKNDKLIRDKQEHLMI